MVNDDGPPNDHCSPYILPFVKALCNAGNTISVVLPDKPQSWISKAHLVGKPLTASPLSPACLTEHECVEWTLVNGTPASCTQLGLHHLTSHRDPVDLVISGPNWGRNITTLYNLASGTVGGALEGAQCGKRAIAISFASKAAQPKHVIDAACAISVKLIAHLYRSWAAEVELYAINVPMISDVGSCKAVYTQSLPCFWSHGSMFTEVENVKVHAEETMPEKPRRRRSTKREFKWQPELEDVERSIVESEEGTDGWAMRSGYIRSVIPGDH